MAGPDIGLRGARVLVTRPAHQAGNLAERITASGGSPVLLPTIEILAPGDPAALEKSLARLPHASLAIFISPNAVRCGLELMRRHGGWPVTLRFAAVGAGTLQALQGAGLQNIVSPTGRYDSEALLDCLPAESLHGRTILLFRGEGGRETLAEALRARGAFVEHAVCYRRAAPVAPDPAVLAQLCRGEIDIITVTSVDGLNNLMTLAERCRDRLLATPLVVLSERQAEAARVLGFHAGIRVAARADDEAVVAALRAWREH